MLRPWKYKVGNALDHSVRLANLMIDVYEKSIVQTEDGMAIQAESGIQSPEYEQFIEEAGVLEKVSLEGLDTSELFCFFLNVYQCMYV